MIGTLAVDGWDVTFGTARRGRSLAVPNVTAHPSTASVPTSYYSMWHCNGLKINPSEIRLRRLYLAVREYSSLKS